MKYIILLGSMTFLNENIDKENKATIHSVNTILMTDSKEEVDSFLAVVERSNSFATDYLVVGDYQYPIELDENFTFPDELGHIFFNINKVWQTKELLAAMKVVEANPELNAELRNEFGTEWNFMYASVEQNGERGIKSKAVKLIKKLAARK